MEDNRKLQNWFKKRWSELRNDCNKTTLLQLLLLPIVFMYLEVAFHLLVFRKIDASILYSSLIALVFGCIITAFSTVWRRKINCIIAMFLVSLVSVWFCVQLVFQHIFRTFLSLYSVGQNGGDVLEFWKEAMNGILAKLPGILVLLLPIPVVAILLKKFHLLERRTLNYAVMNFIGAALVHSIFLVCLLFQGREAHSPFDLYHNDFIQDLGIEKVGILTATRVDIKNIFFGSEELNLDEDVFLAVMTPTVAPPTVTPLPTPTCDPVIKDWDATPTPTPLPTPTPIDTSPNVLNIDFKALAEAEDDETIAKIHKYFSNVLPTNKNEYTGMFEGYNLIFLTAEGFSPWAVDETVTPTLYQLTHTGFVFENFYTPIWWTSTSDGEYVACTGLIPSGTNSFTKSADIDMPLCCGWTFGDLGYTARAYHNHTYTYYHRDRSHPNIGYDYKGLKGGLEVKQTWPESDLEMMQVTIPEFINDDKFHVYYMTVSGHMEYNFFGNSMAAKNKEYVKDLPYSENCKAYIACQKELDLALEYLIDELDKAGVLEKTVIVMSADHYPYGLTNEEINELAGHEVEENFELYKNNLILWNATIKEPVIVDKYCSSLDIMPTLYNLFGMEYDSRLFMGQDILSDAPALVMMSNQSFITDHLMYNSKSGKSTQFGDIELPDNYLKNYISIVKNKFNISGSIIKNNYYSYLIPYLGLNNYQDTKH